MAERTPHHDRWAGRAWFAAGMLSCAADDLRSLPQPSDHWARQGFQHMVPPAPLPSGDAARATVEVWVQLPDGARVTVEDGALSWPPGTIADRVERDPDDPARVLDVRGVEILEDGSRQWRLFRPMEDDAHAPLAGVTFPSGDTAAHDRALGALTARVAASARAAAMSPTRRERHLEALNRKAGCDGCHVPRRPEGADGAVVRRGTDATGLFTPRTVLVDEVPLETYGVDRAANDPFVARRCADGAPPLDGRRPVCADGSLPRASRDVGAGLAARDADTLALCAARSWLRAHLDDAAQATVPPEDACASLNP